MRLRPNRQFSPSAVAVAAIAMGIASAPAAFAQTNPTEQYLSLRHLNPPVDRFTVDRLSDTPGSLRGKTIEVQGRLAGLFPGDDGTNMVIQTDDNGPVLTLSMSQVPTWVTMNTELRILAVVTDDRQDGVGTVKIGLPPLQVIAVTSASDIAAAEYIWKQDAAKRAEKRRQQDAALASANAAMTGKPASKAASGALPVIGRSGVTLASRGGFNRTGSLFNYLSPSAKQTYPAYVAFVRGWNRRLTDQQVDAIAASILEYSERFQVDPRLVVSMIIAESDFHPQETSNKGAMGLVQLMPDEVHDLGLTNPYDSVQNIAGAVYLLRGRLDKYSGGADLTMRHIILALASYNAGMGAVKKYGGVPPYRETQNYVKKIEKIYRHLCGQDT